MSNDSMAPKAPPVEWVMALVLSVIASVLVLFRSGFFWLWFLFADFSFMDFFPQGTFMVKVGGVLIGLVPIIWAIAMALSVWSLVQRRSGALQRIKFWLVFGLVLIVAQGVFPMWGGSVLGNWKMSFGASVVLFLKQSFRILWLIGILVLLRLPQVRDYCEPPIDESDLPYHYRLG